MKSISFINIRSPSDSGLRQPGDGLSVFRRWRFLNTLVISPPRCGKTTLLRDMIRQGLGRTQDPAIRQKDTGVSVGVVDERSELGACYQGVPQNDLGMRTDVLDCCPKARA